MSHVINQVEKEKNGAFPTHIEILLIFDCLIITEIKVMKYTRLFFHRNKYHKVSLPLNICILSSKLGTLRVKHG